MVIFDGYLIDPEARDTKSNKKFKIRHMNT